jgi:hypothetical protein
MAVKPQLLGSDHTEFGLIRTTYQGLDTEIGDNSTGGPILEVYYKSL